MFISAQNCRKCYVEVYFGSKNVCTFFKCGFLDFKSYVLPMGYKVKLKYNGWCSTTTLCEEELGEEQFSQSVDQDLTQRQL